MIRDKKLIWTIVAKRQLWDIYNFIKEDSAQNAVEVRRKILLSTRSIQDHPLKHSPDKLKQDNDGSFRAYEIYRYRIMYEVTETSIIIHRINHARREPKKY